MTEECPAMLSPTASRTALPSYFLASVFEKAGEGAPAGQCIDLRGGRPVDWQVSLETIPLGMRSPSRRRFLVQAGSVIACGLPGAVSGESQGLQSSLTPTRSESQSAAVRSGVRLFLCGDLMTGRGLDQIMRHPSDPVLHERFAKVATHYVEIAEEANGPIPRNVPPSYIWGDALAELDRARPDARIGNLETAVTTSNDFWLGKSIHYRMHPANVTCLSAGKLDCCVLANNHSLDWAYTGLRETVASLRKVGVRTAGAGNDMAEAARPAVIELRPRGRVLVFSFGSPSSGIPEGWQATPFTGGVNRLNEADPTAVDRVASSVRDLRLPGDLIVVSIHWGSNWGYEVSSDQRRLAHELIDEAGVDVVYGHSSHHPLPIEVYRGKLILYGCGDFINDYEGIGRHDAYRPELGFLYLPDLDAVSGQLRHLTLVPTRIRKFRVNRASPDEVAWLAQTMDREGHAFGTLVKRTPQGNLELSWT